MNRKISTRLLKNYELEQDRTKKKKLKQRSAQLGIKNETKKKPFLFFFFEPVCQCCPFSDSPARGSLFSSFFCGWLGPHQLLGPRRRGSNAAWRRNQRGRTIWSCEKRTGFFFTEFFFWCVSVWLLLLHCVVDWQLIDTPRLFSFFFATCAWSVRLNRVPPWRPHPSVLSLRKFTSSLTLGPDDAPPYL